MSSEGSPRVIDGKYRVVRLLGEGGMGAVYEARHTGTGRRVAVKEIVGDTLKKNADIVTRFQREARATGEIETQHIAHVLDTGTDAATGHPYLVMEFLVGEDVQHLMERIGGPLPHDVALRIVAQACIGLVGAHDAGVVHRDIKPANLYLARRDAGEVVVKILDFGIAKIKMDQFSSVEQAGITKTGAMLGSPLYMSPEQAKGTKGIDARTDVWSLGVVLYELLSGRTPHGDSPTLGSLILAICSEPPTPVQDLAPWVPRDVAAIVHRALWMNPEGRFASMKEMLEAVKAQLPGGWSLNESMLSAGVPAEARTAVAARLELSGNVPPPSTTGSGGKSHASSAFEATLADTGGAKQQSTTAGFAQSNPATTSSTSRSRLPLAIGTVAVLAAAGFGVYRLEGGSKAPATAPVVSTAPQTPSATTPVASASPSASSAPGAASAAARTVPLGVPSGAKVEVDGESATVSSGVVLISGPSGSKHSVHVMLGPRQTTTDVFITDTGAVPERIDVATGPAAAKPNPGTATGSTPQIKTDFK